MTKDFCSRTRTRTRTNITAVQRKIVWTDGSSAAAGMTAESIVFKLFVFSYEKIEDELLMEENYDHVQYFCDSLNKISNIS